MKLDAKEVLELVPLPKNYISHGAAMTYEICPKKYEYVYIKRMPYSLDQALVRGKAVHRAVQEDMVVARDTKQHLKTSDVLDSYDESYGLLVKEAEATVGLNAPEDEDPAQVKDRGYAALELFHQTEATTYQPELVEQKFEVTFPDEVFRLRGVIDEVETGRTAVTDWKTMKAANVDPWPPRQLALYGIAMPTAKTWQIAGMVTTKTPKLIKNVYPATPEAQNEAFETIQQIVKGIRTGTFPRRPGWNSMNCRKCPFRVPCRTAPVYGGAA